mmetsp:Transcript_44687/g.142303  ORF Transcript_44687/g.142303 Transcript_44687/m.142303 type:complete len:359 (+) Transcript_44687:463-1539(+)
MRSTSISLARTACSSILTWCWSLSTSRDTLSAALLSRSALVDALEVITSARERTRSSSSSLARMLCSRTLKLSAMAESSFLSSPELAVAPSAGPPSRTSASYMFLMRSISSACARILRSLERAAPSRALNCFSSCAASAFAASLEAWSSRRAALETMVSVRALSRSISPSLARMATSRWWQCCSTWVAIEPILLASSIERCPSSRSDLVEMDSDTPLRRSISTSLDRTVCSSCLHCCWSCAAREPVRRASSSASPSLLLLAVACLATRLSYSPLILSISSSLARTLCSYIFTWCSSCATWISRRRSSSEKLLSRDLASLSAMVELRSLSLSISRSLARTLCSSMRTWLWIFSISRAAS